MYSCTLRNNDTWSKIHLVIASLPPLETVVVGLVLGGSSRTLSLRKEMSFASWTDQDRVNVPPGAVGGLYGSGCFHLSNNFSVSLNNI